MITIADCVKDYKTETFEIKPEEAIENLFLGWSANDKTGQLSGMERGNKTFEALEVMKFLKKVRKANTEEAIELTKNKLNEIDAYKTSEIIEEFFTGWLGTHYSNIGGERDVQIYQAYNKIKLFFRQMSVTDYILQKQ